MGRGSACPRRLVHWVMSLGRVAALSLMQHEFIAITSTTTCYTLPPSIKHLTSVLCKPVNWDHYFTLIGLALHVINLDDKMSVIIDVVRSSLVAFQGELLLRKGHQHNFYDLWWLSQVYHTNNIFSTSFGYFWMSGKNSLLLYFARIHEPRACAKN